MRQLSAQDAVSHTLRYGADKNCRHLSSVNDLRKYTGTFYLRINKVVKVSKVEDKQSILCEECKNDYESGK